MVYFLIQFLFILNLLFFGISYILYKKYKVYEIQTDIYPKITVIIPAYNEGVNVKKSIATTYNANYPKDKLQIIVVNDGSKDNTSDIIKEQIKGKNIIFIDLSRNKGKRNAIYRAVQRSKGQIIVTVDSDSEISKDSLKSIAKPFIIDSTIGAVAGNILVKNKGKFIPDLLSSAFVFGFCFLRSSQSVFESVLCTPGAFSAYRKSAIINNIKQWSKALFLCHRANIGQDRALTTIVLKNNFKVVYQDTAVCYTNVPQKLLPLMKMFVRWIRGDIRQSSSVVYFINNFKQHKWNFNIYGLIYLLFMQFIWLLTPFLLMYIIATVYSYQYFIIISLLFTIFWSILPFYICYKHKNFKQAVCSVLYGFLNMFILFWLIPYSWFTVYKSGWLTRNKKKQ